MEPNPTQPPAAGADVAFYSTNKAYRDMLEANRSNEIWFADYYRQILTHSMTDSRLLDCGCGTGVTTSYIHQMRPHIQGVDFSSLFIDEARRHGDYFAVMDVSHLQFPDAHFDLVSSADAIEHLSDLEGALREMTRVLKPGGYLVLQAPNLSCGVLSTNYPKTPAAVLRRTGFFLKDLVSPRLRTIHDHKLDVLGGDKDAHNLISPLWLKHRLRTRGFEVVWLTTFALYFTPRPAVRVAAKVLSLLPLMKYIGGRIVLTARKRASAVPMAG